MRRVFMLFTVAAALVVVSAASALAQPSDTNCPVDLITDPVTGNLECPVGPGAKGKLIEKKGAKKEEKKELPKTGGGSVVPIAAISMLLGTGIVGYALIRRR